MTGQRRLAFLATAALIVAVSPQAEANGRFPYANQLVVDPSDANHIVLRTTYGILQSNDRGKTFQWVCERAVGYSGTFDPAIGILSGGATMAGLFSGLAISADRLCTWNIAKGPLEKNFVIDVAVDPSNTKRAVALTSTGLGDAGFYVIVGETLDGGASFRQLGARLPEDFNSETIDIAPSDPSRLYASGIAGTPRVGVFERSEDNGKSWVRTTIALDRAGDKAPYIAAVDPTDANRIYVRIDSDPGDRLIMSRDGGKTFTQIAETKGDMLGFALSPDGKTILLGGDKDFVLGANADELVFRPLARVGVRCLTWTKDALYACATEYPDGFTAAVSRDGGKSFTPLYHLTDLSPLACPIESATFACLKDWPATQDTIGQSREAETGPDTGVRDGGSADASTTPTPAPEPSCRCGLPSQNKPSAWALSSMIAIALTIRSRRHFGKRGNSI